MRLTGMVLLLLMAGCQRAESTDVGPEPSNFTPPSADATPTPIRVIDNSVIRDLAAGKTEGVTLLDLRRVPAAARRRVAAERVEDAECHDGDAAACARRDALIDELKRGRWCWGPDAEVEADRRWMRRGAGCRG